VRRMAAILDDHKLFRQMSPSGSGAASGAMPNQADLLRIGLVNNMPDSAVLRTEQQFTHLLQSSANDVCVEVVLYALPTVPRLGSVRAHIEATYEPIEALCNDTLDGIVVTGTEPLERDLRDEAFWGALAGLVDWIDDRGLPAMFSCLAAHAAVLHADGVPRTRLANKCFGVFEEDVARHHVLMEGTDARMWMPHTRWNQVTEADLRKAGYDILSRSGDAGVGYFARHRNGLWLLCQGHPEYDGANLLREYRRDVARFLQQQRATYPELPRSYFGEHHTTALHAFRQEALAHGNASFMASFPRILHGSPTWDAWQSGATSVFGNWLKYAAAAKPSRDAGRSRLQPGQPDTDGPDEFTAQHVPEPAPMGDAWGS